LHTMADGIVLGYGDSPVALLPKFGNRHGLIAGATGTGKTVTLQRLAEGFSAIGTPVFLADVKGDLAGMSMPGGGNPKIEDRVAKLGIQDMEYAAAPVIFWDIYGEQGHPIRGTVSDMGPLLLSRLLNLNETQEGVINATFKAADDDGLLLLDLKDLRSMLGYMAEHAKEMQTQYGNITSASVGAVQRSLLTIEQQGADKFFGEPALKLTDLMRTSNNGKGHVSILAADKLMQSPRMYATFLLWLLSELFEELPEVGDLPQPKLVFIFDEAHLLFDDAPKALIEKVEQVVRLIRSKGVGVYFVTQNPLDVPETILGQLSNRVQHALRAFTPRDQKAVRTAAETFRPNPALNTEEVITQLQVGEALVSTLDETGTPTIVQRALIRPPGSRIGPVTPDERRGLIDHSPVQGLYEDTVDRESAFEMLQNRAEQASQQAAQQQPSEQRTYDQPTYRSARANPRPGVAASVATSVLKSAGSQLGRSLVRGLLGSLFKGR